jgi:hypothetical protein
VLSLAANLRFSGESALSCASVTSTQSDARVCVVNSATGNLRLPQGLVLSGSLALETAGVDFATAIEVHGRLDLGGHTLSILGGPLGVLRFVDASGSGGGFVVEGSGKPAFDWQGGMLTTPWILRTFTSRWRQTTFVLPSGVEWNVGSSGNVDVWSTSFENRGSVRLQEDATLEHSQLHAHQWRTGTPGVRCHVPEKLTVFHL